MVSADGGGLFWRWRKGREGAGDVVGVEAGFEGGEGRGDLSARGRLVLFIHSSIQLSILRIFLLILGQSYKRVYHIATVDSDNVHTFNLPLLTFRRASK